MVNETELNKVMKTRLKDIELALNESSIVAITDSKGTIQFVNDRFCKMSQYSKEELLGSKQSIVNSGYHSREFFKEMWRTIGTGNVWKGELKNRAKDGSIYWVDTTIVPVMKENGKPDRYISIRHDITKLKKYEETISQMAYYDSLTLLPNRNYLSEWLNNCDMKKDESLTCLFIDIDRFKSINDTFGHRTGDSILLGVARRLESCIDSKDLIVRLGGDEFVVFLKSLEDKQAIKHVVENIIDQFAKPFNLPGDSDYITISIGISNAQPDKDEDRCLQTMEKLIRYANTAMFHAKKTNGNSYCFNTKDQNKEQDRYYKMEFELRDALENDEFHIVYQPLMNLKENQLVGVEALLRWKNEKLGHVSPGEFIPILEELGTIDDVGKWVLESVGYQMKAWYAAGMEIPRVAVNVSPIQFRNEDFVKDVKKILEETNLPAEQLELEITEGTILHSRKSEKILKELRDLNLRISLDDFGTGYSSLARLKQLPINTLKIDRSFIDDLDDDGEVIVDTIISMGRTLNFNIVAEGIETEEQLTYLKQVDCHEGQGYYFSRPVTAEEIAEKYGKALSY